MRPGRNVSLALILSGWIGMMAAPIGYADDADVTLQGTGATFPAPLYQRWFTEYNKLHPEVQINYQALGSGAGVKQFQDGLVNFGASDAAMTDEEIAAVKDGVVLLPMTAGSIVLAYNLPGGPKELKLSREAYVGIFLGKITKWNDPKIAKANPGVTLPDTKITVVTRSDGSGTTFVFTQHLSAISDDVEERPRHRQVGELPGRRRRQGQPRRHGARSSRPPARSATSSTATPSRRRCRWRSSRTRAASS